MGNWGRGQRTRRDQKQKLEISVAIKSHFDSLMAGFFIRGSARIQILPGRSALIRGDGRTQCSISKNG